MTKLEMPTILPGMIVKLEGRKKWHVVHHINEEEVYRLHLWIQESDGSLTSSAPFKLDKIVAVKDGFADGVNWERK